MFAGLSSVFSVVLRPKKQQKNNNNIRLTGDYMSTKKNKQTTTSGLLGIMSYMNLNKLCLNQSNTEVEERMHVVTLTRTVGRRHSVVMHTYISFFQCCFTSIRPIRDGEPRTAASTFTQLLSSDVQCCRNQSAETTRLIRDSHFDFHTAPKL